jgi:CheY-like chemotaxis protein
MSDASKKLIVLVDDDIDCLEVHRHILETAGYEVVACFDGDEAFEKMATRQPDLIVTDLMMSNLDSGFAFTRRVKQDSRYAGIPVIVVTAVAKQLGFDFRPRGGADLSAMGIEALLDKPVRADLLVETVQDLLARLGPA